MKRIKMSVGAAAVCAASAVAWGCASDVDETASEVPLESPVLEAKTLVSFQVGDRSLEILEDVPGEFVISENGPTDAGPLLEPGDSQLPLADLYRKLEPRMTTRGASNALSVLADADRRIEQKRKSAPIDAGTFGLDLLQPQSMGEPAPNFFDFAGDNAWFRQNFCKPGTYCETWVYWAHSGGKTNIRDWQCTVLNHADFGIARATLRAKTCDGLCIGSTWEVSRRATLGAREYQRWYSTASGTYLGRACEGDGVDGTWVAVGLYWKNPPPPIPQPPPASCGIAYRAHTTTCRNANGSVSTAPSMCGDGCGSTADAAKNNARASLARQTCIGNAPGCCEVEIDQNFNWCGY